MQDLTYALSRPNKIFDQFFGMPLKAREGTGASELSLEKDRFKVRNYICYMSGRDAKSLFSVNKTSNKETMPLFMALGINQVT